MQEHHEDNTKEDEEEVDDQSCSNTPQESRSQAFQREKAKLKAQTEAFTQARQ